jgi:hypothetical protein
VIITFLSWTVKIVVLSCTAFAAGAGEAITVTLAG